MRVKPKAGMIVRRPAPPYTPVPEKGADVPRTAYWNRRVKDGDLIVVKEEKRKPSTPKPSPMASNKDRDK